MEGPFPRHRLVPSCSSCTFPGPKSHFCFALSSPRQGSRFQKKDPRYWETWDLGLPCTEQVAYWQPSISTHVGVFDVPNASGLSQTAPKQNRRQEDGVLFSSKLQILKLTLSSFANLGLQHPCWLLPPLLSSTHMDIQFLTHVSMNIAHFTVPLCIFCKTHSNMYMSKFPSCWGCSSLILPCLWQFRTHLWRCSMVILWMNIHELAFVYDIMHLGPSLHISYGKITDKFWFLFCPIYASTVFVCESILWNHKLYPIISASHRVGLWVGWFFLFYFLHGYQWVREQQKRKRDHTGKPNILVFVFVFLLHESFFASRSHLWGWNTARSGLLVVFLPSREWNTLSRTDLTLFQLHRVLPEAPARNISTATKAQKMLETQTQVLNSRSSFLRGISGQVLCPPWLGQAALLGWVSCKSLLWVWVTALSPIQTAGSGLCECLQVHGLWLEAITLPGCTRELGTRSLSFSCCSFTITWIQEGAAVWSHHTHIKTSSWHLSVPPSGPVAGAHLSWRVPSLIPHSRVLHCQPEPRPQGGKGKL